LATLVVILNGNAFSAVGPNALTANAAAVIQRAGDPAIQLSTPATETPRDFHAVAHEIESISHGQPIGLVGFSAGGALAARLAGVGALKVKAVLDCYGPPDFRDYLDYHGHDRFVTYFVGRIRFSPGFIDLMSGPCDTSAYVVCAFGLDDQNVNAAVSTASFERDYVNGQVYDYPGPHGVSIDASPAALKDFLTHLRQSSG
jgi:hypothetical protein